jgi:hypothetical protein
LRSLSISLSASPGDDFEAVVIIVNPATGLLGFKEQQ